MTERGTLKELEPHPAIHSALEYYNGLSISDWAIIRESMASCAIEGNRLGEICCETLNRFEQKKKVSDRYLLGLVWAIKDIMEAK